MTTSQPSLRERHRARTLAGIHQAALDLAGEGSYSDTTVDAVAERAGVGTLALTHLVPGRPGARTWEQWHSKAQQGFSGTVVVGADLATLAL